MSKYFEPIEFQEDKEVKKEEKKNQDLQGDLKPVFKEIAEELNRIQQGTSEHVGVAIHFPKGHGPVLVAFSRLQSNPTRPNLNNFLQMCEQDISFRVRDHFASLFKGKV